MIDWKTIPRRAVSFCRLGWLGALGAWWVATFAPLLFTTNLPYYRDLIRTYYPVRTYMASRLRAGALPQWYPFENLGEPFIGQVVTGVFHPLSIIYLIVGPLSGLKIEILLCYLVAWLGMGLLCRAAGLSWRATAAGTLAFGLSGYLFAMSNNLPYLRGVATLPLLSWSLLRLVRTPRPLRWVPVAACVWASILLGGDLQTYLLGGLVAVTVAGQSKAWRRLGWILVAGLLSLGISAVELVPAYTVKAQGIRSGIALAINGKYWALYPLRLLELAVPGWIPTSVRSAFVHGVFGMGTAVWATSIFVGSIVLFLAIGAGLRGGPARWWLALAVVGLWMALGWYGGLHTLARAVIPLLDDFRFPEKYFVVVVLGLAMAAGYGVDRASHSSRSIHTAMALGGALVVFAGLLRWTTISSYLLRHIATGLNTDLTAAVSSAWSTGTIHSGVALVVLGVLLWLSRTRPATSIALPLLLGIDLWFGTHGLIPLVDRASLTTEPSLCGAAIQAGAGLGKARLMPAATHFPYSETTPEGAQLWVRGMLNVMEPDAAGLCPVEALGYNLPGLPRRVRALLGFKAHGAAPYRSLFNVPFLVSDGTVPGVHPLAGVAGFDYVLGRSSAAPRAYLGTPRFVDSANEALTLVRKDPKRAEVEPILEGHLPIGLSMGPASTTDSVSIIDYRPEHVDLGVKAHGGRALVLNDMYYPGWSATVDGNPAPIFPTNYLARSVLIGPGEHRVEFKFQMPGLALGVRLMGLSLVICLGMLLVDQRRTNSVAMK